MKKNVWKKALAVILASVCVAGTLRAPGTAVKAAELPDSLKGYWNFESMTGSTTVNNGVSGGVSGTISGGNVSVVEGTTFQHSMRFTSGGNDGVMTVPDILNKMEKAFTISLWYKVDETANRSADVVLLQQSGEGRTMLFLTSGNGYDTYINSEHKSTEGGIVDVSRWQHVAISYNPGTNKVSIYANGKQVLNTDAGTTDQKSVKTNLLIGCHKNPGDANHVVGDMDEIRLYEKELTEAEVKTIYDNDAAPVVYEELTAKIAEAQKLYDSNKIGKDHASAVALQAEITEAGKLSADSTVAQLEQAISDLDAAIDNYNDQSAPVLRVDPSKVLRTADKSLFGINHRYAFNGYGTFDTETQKVKDEFAELYKEAGFGSVRYPGGTISNLFNWKTTLGPLDERVKQIHGFYNYANQHGIAPNFGLAEIGTFAQESGSEIVYVYGMGRGSAQDAADLIEYLNAPVGLNPNGGVDWAQVRKDNGHEKPFNVRYFEIGNETWQGGGDGSGSQMYWIPSVQQKSTIDTYIEGGTATFDRQYAVLKDDWNSAVSGSDGTAGQVRYMRYANLNPMDGEDGKELKDDFVAVNKDSVHIYVNNAEWTQVDNFETSGPNDQHVVVDWRDGSFTFGDGVHGAIPAKGNSITVSYSVEKDGFAAIAEAMKDVTAKINEATGEHRECNTYSAWDDGSQNFITHMEQKGYTDLYDGMTIHPYSGTTSGMSPGSAAETFYDEALKRSESGGVSKVKTYVEWMPEGKVPVISEFGIYNTTHAMVRSQTHAVYIAKVMMDYVKLGSPYIQKHCLADWYSTGADALGPTQQAVIQVVAQEGADKTTGEGDFRYFSTPSARVFQMLNTAFGDKVVEAEFDRIDQTSAGYQAYSALVSTDEKNNVYAAIVNADRENSKTIEIAVDGFDADGKTVRIQRLESESISSENSLDNPDNVAVKTEEVVNKGETVSIELQPHSFVVATIVNTKIEKFGFKEPAVTQYQLGDELDLHVEAVFSDGKTEDVTDKCQIQGYDAQKLGEQTVTATYEFGGQKYTASIKVTVSEVPPADKGELQSRYDKYARRMEEQGFEEHYTPESWNAYKEGMEAVKALLNQTDATQEEIDQAYTNLETLHKALQPKVSAEAFTDVKEAWMVKNVENAYQQKLMTGKTADTFAPVMPINRAEVAVVIHRMAGSPKEEKTATFTDLTQGWYKEAVNWASAAKKGDMPKAIVTGYSETEFRPGNPISRQEIAMMLYRYAAYMGYDTSTEEDPNAAVHWADLYDENDKPWGGDAETALRWCVAKGLITGNTKNGKATLDPFGTAYRVQAAAIFSRFADKFEN